MARLTVHEKAGFFGDAVFAASDGIITTFAIVAGSAGASLGVGVVLVLGFANLFADSFSMSAGNYLGVKSEIEYENVKSRKHIKEGSPILHAFVTFSSFNLAGLIPLIPFITRMPNAFSYSLVMVALSMFMIGGFRTFYTKKNFLISGLEMLAVGSFAAFVAFGIGFLVDRYLL